MAFQLARLYWRGPFCLETRHASDQPVSLSATAKGGLLLNFLFCSVQERPDSVKQAETVDDVAESTRRHSRELVKSL